MKGYKVFEPDWTCRGFQFKVGEIFEEDVKPVCCEKGFHFSTNAVDCFTYYSFKPSNKVAEVKALGDIDTDSDGSKCCTNKIYIIREITWHEVLDLVNQGTNCTGLGNSGNCNSGNRNSGDFNSGNRNSGDRNSGDYNSGYRNSGYRNSGDYNSGNYNSGDYNSGNYNSGYRNSGDYNSGNYNSGDYNSGNYNSGDCNSGDRNSGDWNKSSFSNGCFNTESQKIFLFNKLSDISYQDWLKSEAKSIMMGCPSNNISWVFRSDMTDEEKKEHPECNTTGGFLKEIKRETGRQEWWDGLSDREKDIVMQLPNFDKGIFKEITGIDV